MCRRTREPTSDFASWRASGAASFARAVAQLAQGADAAAVERGEFDPELAAAAAFAAPGHAALDHDFAAALFETANQRRAVVGQVGGAQMHAARADVDRFGLEGGNSGLVSANFDQGFDPHAACALGATFLNFGHGCLQRGLARDGQVPASHPE